VVVLCYMVSFCQVFEERSSIPVKIIHHRMRI
jgi:hypothetical protein